MSLTTATYALPYPEETDTADVPRDLQALAERVEAVLPGVGVPPGGGIDWYAAVAPSGFLLCDGSAVSRATFAALFAVVGTTWGGGDGLTTFNLPDTRGRVLVGLAPGGNADVNALALSDGAALGSRRVRHFHPNGLTTPALVAAHTLTLPAHVHVVNDPTHGHNIFQNQGGPDSGQQAVNINGATTGAWLGGEIQASATGVTVGNPTTAPAINGGVTVAGGAIVGAIGPAANAPQDGPSYVVAAKAIKT